jgi:hypothetical protein
MGKESPENPRIQHGQGEKMSGEIICSPYWQTLIGVALVAIMFYLIGYFHGRNKNEKEETQ